jgi:hypothetical protein
MSQYRQVHYSFNKRLYLSYPEPDESNPQSHPGCHIHFGDTLPPAPGPSFRTQATVSKAFLSPPPHRATRLIHRGILGFILPATLAQSTSTKLLITQFSPPSYRLVLLPFKYSPQHPHYVKNAIFWDVMPCGSLSTDVSEERSISSQCASVASYN